ncbi:MAG: NERD domain-containing protein [Clostridiaceae bacterium]|nr:NERD domain-containing protein [Clostridiaceae bacterium]
MGLFDKIKEPVILKEDSEANERLHAMEQLLAATEDPKIKAALESDMAAVKAGISGEDAVLFELKNSHIPMFVLHDLYLKYDDLSAQIDYLIVTRHRNFVVECKNLYGNITVNNNGDFVRSLGNRKEGIYSPITQNRRHLELIRQMRAAEKKSALTRSLFEKYFYDNYRSVAVLANPKTVLNVKYASQEIKNQVIRADQLSEYIRKVNGEKDAADVSESNMEQLAWFFYLRHQPCPTDYLDKYRPNAPAEPAKTPAEAPTAAPAEKAAEVPPPPPAEDSGGAPRCPKCGAPMVRRKAARGKNAGQEFWGCANYPRCRGIIEITQAE